MFDPFLFLLFLSCLTTNQLFIRIGIRKKKCTNINPYVDHKESINISIDTTYIASRVREIEKQKKNKCDNGFLINSLETYSLY
jgi:hypothetical protein